MAKPMLRPTIIFIILLAPQKERARRAGFLRKVRTASLKWRNNRFVVAFLI